MIWNWFWILNDDDYKRSPSTETKDKRTRQTLCGDEASAQTHTGDGGVNCNSAALTGPSLNNRKAEMCQKYKKKTVTQDTWPLKPAPPFTHMKVVSWWEVFTGRHNPRNHISIFIIIIIVIIIFPLWYEHQGYRLPLRLTSPRCDIYTVGAPALLLAVFATEWTCDGFILTAAESSTWTADLRCNTVQTSCACA